MELKLHIHIQIFFFYILLIVPYGIETDKGRTYNNARLAFNRTLWN